MINIDELLKDPVLEKVKNDFIGEFYVKLLNSEDLEKALSDKVDDVIKNGVLDEKGNKALSDEDFEKFNKQIPFKYKKSIQDDILRANGIDVSIFDLEKK